MKIGVTKFPGTNNEQDVLRALSSFGVEGVLIYEKDADKLKDLNALIIAGGFSFGDYLRPGVIAAKTAIMQELPKFVEQGNFVIGICNGFQILCETGILPGVLTTNRSTKFVSRWVYVKINKSNSVLLRNSENKIWRIPIAHFDGNYYATNSQIIELKKKNQIALQYCDEKGVISEDSNPNGSVDNIAGITNKEGNVLGLMPHPERASFNYLGSEDGRTIFQNLIEELK